MTKTTHILAAIAFGLGLSGAAYGQSGVSGKVDAGANAAGDAKTSVDNAGASIGSNAGHNASGGAQVGGADVSAGGNAGAGVDVGVSTDTGGSSGGSGNAGGGTTAGGNVSAGGAGGEGPSLDDFAGQSGSERGASLAELSTAERETLRTDCDEMHANRSITMETAVVELCTELRNVSN